MPSLDQFMRRALIAGGLIVATISGYASASGLRVNAATPGTASYTYRLGFDTERAPSVSEMQYSWSSYAYFYIGVYSSGNNRAPQPNLTASWVSQVNSIGFGFLPIDVGWQAPDGCGTKPYNRMSADPSTAYNQGVQQAVAAASAARDLGFTGQTPVYLDMEAYNTTNSVCKTAVLEFIRGWLIQMKNYEGRIAGVYGSSSGSDVQSWASITPPPDDIWFAEWNAANEQSPNISVWATSYISSQSWRIQPPYGRFHQFRGDIPNIWFGDVYLLIDQTCAWGVVAGNGYGADSRFPYCPGTAP